MLARRMTVMLACTAIAVGGAFVAPAYGDSACREDCPKAKKKCNLCSWLGKCNLCKKHKCETAVRTTSNGVYAYTSPSGANVDLPPNAKPGECYAKVIIPAQYKTVSERHMVREAAERIEIAPAQYKWVEERVMIKEASTQLEAVAAEYKWTERQIEVRPGHTGWVLQNAEDCVNPDKKNITGDVWCLRTTPPEYKTIRTQCLVRPASTRCVTIPAEFQTVRRQVVSCPATTRKVCVPAEYTDIQRTVMVCPERFRWEHVVCEDKMTTDAVNKVKSALLASGYKPGPMDGTLGPADLNALVAFQQKNGLGVGKLTYDTLKQLGVSLQ